MSLVLFMFARSYFAVSRTANFFYVRFMELFYQFIGLGIIHSIICVCVCSNNCVVRATLGFRVSVVLVHIRFNVFP